MDHKDVRIGQHITWLHEIRKGHSSVKHISGQVVGISPQRVRIQVKRWSNELKKISVKAEKLELKN